MTLTNTIPVTQTANNKAVNFANADSTNLKDIFVAGANGSILRTINACTTDTSTNNVQLFHYDGSTAYLIGTVPVVTLSGTNGSANTVNLLDPAKIPGLPKDNSGLVAYWLKSGEKIQAAPLAAVTAAKTLTLVANGEDY
jgi:hypothetical protein